jgi:hypothetical protein
MGRAEFRDGPAGQLPGPPTYKRRLNVAGINKKNDVEQIFKEYCFEGPPNY